MGAATATGASEWFKPGAETNREIKTQWGARDGGGGAQRDRETHMQERLPKGGLDRNGKCCGMAVPGELGAERETRWERHKETRVHT